ncbi:MAG: glycosyltransferase family 2 protein [Clostridia bacterium]|nr:glycosyltransferase family 2 protein [Clostridia bacterium]
MNNIKYSFVLPAYKRRFIKEAIDSILAQTYTEFELIIINDASPENLDTIINSYNDKRISYYTNEQNIGGKSLVMQWNHCIKYAQGEYLILASDDDIYHPEYLYTMNSLTEKYPNVNIFRPRIQIIDEKGDFKSTEAFMHEHMTLLDFMYLYSNHYITGGIPFYLFKKKAITDIGGFIDFPLAWGSDDATALTIMQTQGIVTTNEILFSFRMSGENISSKKNNSKTLSQKLNARIMYFKIRERIIEKIETTNVTEEKHLEWIKRNSSISIQDNIYALIRQSTIYACLCNYKTISKITGLKKRWIMIQYLKRVAAILR